jgi:hypothetical protein
MRWETASVFNKARDPVQESGAGILQDCRAGRIRAPDRVFEETKVISAGTVLCLDRSPRA